jgi:hypothetical protein
MEEAFLFVEVPMDDLNTVDDGTTDQTGTDQSVTGQTDQATTEQGSDGFLSDEALMAKIRSTPELEQVFKKMQGAYTRKTQNLASMRESSELVNRFNSDPDFARQTILQRAGQLGLNLQQPGQQSGLQGASKTMPPDLVEAVKANLSPELQWMAPALAASQWAGMQLALQPMQEQQAQSARSTRDQQYDQLATQLSEKAPGWESHEDDMDGLLTFLQSPKMTDRRWGSKLDLLYKLVAGDGQATAEAARRMGVAAKSRAVAGQPVAAPVSNVAEQVRKPKQNQDAWDIAAKFAMSELARQGIKVS